jgi:hypothetical protein
VGVNTLGVTPGKGFGTFFSQRVDEVRQILQDNKIQFAEDTRACTPSDLQLTRWILLLAAALLLALSGAAYVYMRLQKQMAGRPISTQMLRRAFNEVGMTRLLGRSRISPRPEAQDRAKPAAKPALVPDNPAQPVITLEAGRSMTIGRDPRVADVVINDEAISRQHVRIQAVQGRIEVEDLGSYNGSYIDGKRLRAGQATQLGARQCLTLGSARVAYRVQDRK